MTRPFYLLCVVLICLASAPIVSAVEKPSAEVKKGKADTKPIQLFDGKTLAGWKIIDKHYYDAPGKVTVKDGVITMQPGKPATGVVVTRKSLPRMNYELSFDARRDTGSDFFCGLTFPIDKSYCTLVVGGWGGGLTGLSNVDSFAADENETTDYLEFKNGQWYKIRLQVAEARISVWIDKKQIVDLRTKDKKFAIWWEQEPVRPLGIGTWNTGASLKNIVLKRLDAAAIEAAAKRKSSDD
jgi:hypothetical protein